MKLKALLLGVLVSFAVIDATEARPKRSNDLPPLETVSYVDLARYAGKWYQIASIPLIWERGCVGATATYFGRPDGRIDVINECRRGSFDGDPIVFTGYAEVVEPQTNAKLTVRFDYWPFTGKYWVIDLDEENYQFAAVGHPTRNYLWILSRTPQMDAETYQAILKRVTAKHYDVSRLRLTPQPSAIPQR